MEMPAIATLDVAEMAATRAALPSPNRTALRGSWSRKPTATSAPAPDTKYFRELVDQLTAVPVTAIPPKEISAEDIADSILATQSVVALVPAPTKPSYGLASIPVWQPNNDVLDMTDVWRCLAQTVNVRTNLVCDDLARRLTGLELDRDYSSTRDLVVQKIRSFSDYHERLVARRLELIPQFTRAIRSRDEWFIKEWDCDWGYAYGNDPFDFPWQSWSDFVDDPERNLPRSLREFHELDCRELYDQKRVADELIMLLFPVLP